MPRAFLTARWHYLVMLNYEVDPAVLAPLVPAGTTLNAFEGRTFMSVVGFRFLETRLLGVPVPGHRNFDEVNLRFYVRRDVNGERRRGVTFVRELVPRAAIAALARWRYNEPYLAVPMRSRVPPSLVARPGRLEYGWRLRGEHGRVAATPQGEPMLAGAASAEGFITEHYWGYTRQRDGGTVEYRVSHPPWRVWPAHDPLLVANTERLYGAAFTEPLAAAPHSAFVADGSEVVVYRPVRLAP